MALIRPIKRVSKMAHTIVWGYGTLARIGSLRQPKRDTLPDYINQFCQKLTRAYNINVVAVNDIPKHHALWVSNHISWLDVAVVGSFSPAFFLSKAEVASWPVIGRLATSAGTLFIKRGSGDAGTVNEQMTRFLKDDISVLFFPEATTTDGKQVKKLHGKLLQSAIDAKVPVQPVVICYVNQKKQLDQVVPFIDDMTFGAHLIDILNNNPVTAYVKALPAIDVDGYDKKSLTQKLQEDMQTGLAELHAYALAQ